jgi:hypothetical protein
MRLKHTADQESTVCTVASSKTAWLGRADCREARLCAVPDFRAVFLFAGSGLFIAGDALGLRWTFERGGHRVSIALPTVDEVYKGLADEEPRTARLGRVTAWQEGDPAEIHAVTVERFEVSVDTTAAEPSNDAIGEMFPVAARVAEEFLTWVRVGSNQPWLPGEHEGVSLASYTRLLDIETGAEVASSWNPPLAVVGIPAEQSVDPATLNDFAAALAGEVMPSAATLLLTDAHAALGSRSVYRLEDRERADTAHAILLAAVACEVHIKVTLREAADAAYLPLLDVILDSPRDVTIAAGQLTDKPMDAAVGHSLRSENKPLFKKVTERLFPLRNKVAHYGYKPKLDEAREALKTADELFLWLNDVRAKGLAHPRDRTVVESSPRACSSGEAPGAADATSKTASHLPR